MPMLVANQTVNATASAVLLPTDFRTVLQPGPSNNWTTMVGLDAALDSWVWGQIPALEGNGSDVTGCALESSITRSCALKCARWGMTRPWTPG